MNNFNVILSVTLLSIMFHLNSFQTFAFETKYTDYNFKATNKPERIHTENIKTTAVTEVVNECIFKFSSSKTPKVKQMYLDIAAGRYEEVISSAQKEIENNTPFWEHDSAHLVSEYQRILATAYELNGDYLDALKLWDMVFGDKSEDFRWSLIRIMYASGQKEEAYRHLIREIARYQWIVPEFVKESVHNAQVKASEKKTKRSGQSSTAYARDALKLRLYGTPFPPAPYLIEAYPVDETDNSGLSSNSDWLALLRLRYECARVICPELPFVSTIRLEFYGGSDDFMALQRDSFVAFIVFMKEECEKRASYSLQEPEDDNERNHDVETIDFLNKIKEVPWVQYNGLLPL